MILPFFFALPHAIVSIVLLSGPHAAKDALPGWFPENPFPFVTGVFFVGYCLFRLVLSRKTVFSTIAVLSLAAGFMALVSGWSAINVHRDFFSAVFQYLLCIPSCLLFAIQSRLSGQLKKNTVKALGKTGFVIALFYAQWIMMMGYAISTRTEPRPIESIIYNIFNFILVLILFLTSNRMEKAGTLEVVSLPDFLSLDGKDVSAEFGSKKTALLHGFASAPDRTLRCGEIRLLLNPDFAEMSQECLRCSGETTKAASCKQYRTTYNAILDLKKILELLEIGTISTGENRRLILTEGWKLMLFEDVRVSAKKKPDPRTV